MSASNKSKKPEDGVQTPEVDVNAALAQMSQAIVAGQSQMMELMKGLSSELGGLSKRVGSIEDKADRSATKETERVISKVRAETPKEVDETIQEKRCDPRYREVVDRILGRQFKAWEEYEGVLPGHFRFVVEVPVELSSVLPETHKRAGCDHENEKCKLPADTRTKTISFAEHVNGVEEWCNKIRLNLNKFYSANALNSPFVRQPE